MSKMSKSTHMGFYITYGKNKTFELPVNPAEVSIKYETDDKQTNIISYGEINQIGEYKLRNFDFDFVLPRHMKVLLRQVLVLKKLAVYPNPFGVIPVNVIFNSED